MEEVLLEGRTANRELPIEVTLRVDELRDEVAEEGSEDEDERVVANKFALLVEDADESMVLELEEGADVDKESDLVVDSKGVLAVEELDLAEDKEAEGLLYGDEEELDKVVTTLVVDFSRDVVGNEFALTVE